MPAKHHTDQHCQHISPRGQRCRMLRAADHASLCTHHLRQASAAQPDTEALAAELLGSLDDFSTADSVNKLLSNLVKQLARKRIARLDAIAMAYMCQLLLNSLPPLKKELRAEDEEQARINDEKFQAEFQAWARRKGRPDDSNDAVPQAVPTVALDRPS
ncbi:MAG TPA: hypothetical protein VFF95_08310 [Candidatus Binatus sp.]|nr:hypothetical protein [Candidatus Binatus sp.]